jgi:hypothetical protein
MSAGGAEAIALHRGKTVDELLSTGRLTIDETLPQRPVVGRRAYLLPFDRC